MKIGQMYNPRINHHLLHNSSDVLVWRAASKDVHYPVGRELLQRFFLDSSPLSLLCSDFLGPEQVFEGNAGRTTKFAKEKSLIFSKLILGILLFEFCFTVFFPLGCGVDS